MRQKAARKLEVKGELDIYIGVQLEITYTHTPQVMLLGQADSGMF